MNILNRWIYKIEEIIMMIFNIRYLTLDKRNNYLVYTSANYDCNYKLTWVIQLWQLLSDALPVIFPKILI